MRIPINAPSKRLQEVIDREKRFRKELNRSVKKIKPKKRTPTKEGKD